MLVMMLTCGISLAMLSAQPKLSMRSLLVFSPISLSSSFSDKIYNHSKSFGKNSPGKPEDGGMIKSVGAVPHFYPKNISLLL